MEFVAELYHEQVEGNRYFLHEHPRYATSWQLKCMEQLQELPGVETVRGDQYGAVAPHGPDRGCPVKKPTGFMSNSLEIRHALSRICEGRNGGCSRPEGGRHTACQGSITKDMAKYPRELCRAVLRGLTAQLRADRRLVNGCYGIQAEASPPVGESAGEDQNDQKQIYGPDQGYSGKYKDDLTGQSLRDDLVRAARAKELEFFTSKGVWMKVPRQRSCSKTGKPPICVRWVDVNKGDEDDPNYRSRLVARQLKATDFSGKSYFAPAPHLESLRTSSHLRS